MNKYIKIKVKEIIKNKIRNKHLKNTTSSNILKNTKSY